MQRRSRRCWQNTSSAQGAEAGRDLGDEGQGLLAAACLPVGGHGAEDPPLCLDADRRRRVAAAIEGTGFGTKAVRLGRRRLTVLTSTATTSAERWHREGWLFRSLRNLLCLGLYFLGLPDRLFARLYG